MSSPWFGSWERCNNVPTGAGLERRAKSAECQGESPYEVRLAGRFVPESCATVRKGRREVLTGVSAGEVSSCEIISWRGRCC